MKLVIITLLGLLVFLLLVGLFCNLVLGWSWKKYFEYLLGWVTPPWVG